MEEVVVEALRLSGRDGRIAAAREVAKYNSKQRQRVAEKGVISPLVLMLSEQDYEAIEAALFALLSLAFGSERNKIRIAKSGAIPEILKIIQCQIMPLLDLAAAALLILSSCTQNKLEIAASGAIQLLINLLNLNCDNVSMQAKLDFISTLHNLSTCPQTVGQLARSGCVVSLLQLIYGLEKSSDLVEKIMGLLEEIVSSSDIALKEAAETGGSIPTLVEAMEDGSTQCKEHAVGILLVICQNCRDRYRGIILREGVMPGLLQLSVDGTWRGKEKAKELLLLLRDCSNCGSKSKQSKNVLLEKVMREIDRGERGGTSLKLVEEMIAKLRT
ncbi:U-box domain-containing protein 2-like [Olea europaea var. sylvestris]|uniref:U-box domain-containing 3 n=1 Tax=Olea europaea subsp. europaea TaxID=158383 RepID=A0A8S0UUA5_OLEEU|nr:U-box domain-containing protein 2-like [Olea europaea var. sylvestris]CAA3021651.1 u-box domain-containing 3 [Olea europaea subsp. europaea]